ncbi:MAG: hypothetical protein KDD82_16515 [Planctomycetes bacterium]|nr:hypothetical protein [Planctomycetota bacterium]
MPRGSWAAAVGLALLVGCTTGPGKKPGTMGWKVFTEETPLSFPPTAWTSGGLRFEMTEARYERRHTVLEDQSYSLRFEFKVRNVGSEAVDLNASERPQASLVLADGSQAPSMHWVYVRKNSAPLLEPGHEAGGLLFDNSVPEGARPKLLTIATQRAEW